MIVCPLDIGTSDLKRATDLFLARFPKGDFRVRGQRYPSGTDFVGTTRACFKYIVNGSVWLGFGGAETFVPTGHLVYLVAGDYRLRVPDGCDVELVAVWDLSFMKTLLAN